MAEPKRNMLYLGCNAVLIGRRPRAPQTADRHAVVVSVHFVQPATVARDATTKMSTTVVTAMQPQVTFFSAFCARSWL